MSDEVIVLENVWKIFGARADEALEAIESRGLGKPEVLEEFQCVVGIADCSFTVERGEIFCVMGLSGSGKSTMVRHLNRLIEPTAGKITMLGRDVLGMGPSELRELRARHIGMVFQHMALLPHRTVRDNVAFPLQVRGEPKSRRWEVSQACLSRVNLDGYEDRFPSELSDFVEGISRLKLVFAHSIMEPIADYQARPTENLAEGPRVHHGTDLDQLIDISVTTEQPIVVTDDENNDVGVINRATLLKGIQGGKA